MPSVILPLDLTGNLAGNRITEEEHILTVGTGRCFAFLLYGGFYSASLVIRNVLTSQYLVPVTDYLVLAPYDDITRQSGKEAACAILINKTSFTGTYEVTYQAVGGEFATNVEALQDVLSGFNQDINTVHWNSVIDKPVGFNTAPHLIDFRTDLFGFEGLIQALVSLEDKISSPGKGALAAVLNTINALLLSSINGVNISINDLQEQIDVLAVGGGGDTDGGYLVGTAANQVDIDSGTNATKYINTANIVNLAKRLCRGQALATTGVNTLDTATEPLYSGNFNLRTNSKGDATVPNSIEPYIIETKRWNTGSDRFTQYAYSVNTKIVLKRERYDSVLTLWTRVDLSMLGTAAAMNRSNTSPDAGGDLLWVNPSDLVLTTPRAVKRMIEDTVSTGRVLQDADRLELHTTIDPTLWITTNMSHMAPDIGIPSGNESWLVKTILSPLNNHCAFQTAETMDGIKIYRFRTPVGPSYGTWVRSDNLSNALTSWTKADKDSNADKSWVNPIANKAVDPEFLKNYLIYNASWLHPVGTISLWAGPITSAPDSFKHCNGALYSRIHFPELFSILGTIHGTTTSTNFRVPDLRGVFVRGLDNRTPNIGGLDPDQQRYDIEDIGLGWYQVDTIQNIVGEAWGNEFVGGGPWGFEGTSGCFSFSGNVDASTVRGSSSGNGRKLLFNASGAVRTSTETRPRNKALHYIIKADNRL